MVLEQKNNWVTSSHLGLMAQATLGSNDIKDPHEFAI
jgi:hypothetical protein